MISALSFSSRERDLDEFPDANNYELDVPKLRQVREIRLAGLEMPSTHMTIEEGGNNLIHFSEGLQVPAGPSDVPLPDGSGGFYHHNQVVIEVAEPSREVGAVSSGEPQLRIEQGCDVLRIRHERTLTNPTGRVVYVPPEARADKGIPFDALPSGR